MAMTLEFVAEDHKYYLDGVEIPSVTTILEVINDFSKVPRARLEAARQLGIAVHKATELYDLDDLDHDSIHPSVAPYLAAYGQFLNDSKYKITHIEQRIYSQKYGFAGTLDRAGAFPDAKSQGSYDIVDIKTSAQLGPSVGPQLAAYETGFREFADTKICRVFGLQLKPNGTYKLEQYKNKSRDMAVFLSCLNIFNYMKKAKK